MVFKKCAGLKGEERKTCLNNLAAGEAEVIASAAIAITNHVETGFIPGKIAFAGKHLKSLESISKRIGTIRDKLDEEIGL